MNRLKKGLNIFINIMIIIAILQTFFEEYSVIQLGLGGKFWTVQTKYLLVIIGLVIDIIFSLEFLVRFANAIANKRVKAYFLKDGGWIDLLASLPLLLFYSSWRVYFLSFSVTGMDMTKVIQVVRLLKGLKLLKILRSVRLLRVARIVKFNRHNADKQGAATATMIAITSLIAGLLLSSLLFIVVGWSGPDRFAEKRGRQMVKMVENQLNSNASTAAVRNTLKQTPYFVSLYINGTLHTERYTSKAVRSVLDTEGIEMLEAAIKKDGREVPIQLYYLRADVNKHLARNNIMMMILVLSVWLGVYFVYGWWEKRQSGAV